MGEQGRAMALERFDEQLVFEKVKNEYGRLLSQKNRQLMKCATYACRSMFMNKTILVTGAAGFIGSHASQAFLTRGDTVVGLDNLNDYYDPARKLANLAEVQASAADNGQFTFVKGNVPGFGSDRKAFCREYV